MMVAIPLFFCWLFTHEDSYLAAHMLPGCWFQAFLNCCFDPRWCVFPRKTSLTSLKIFHLVFLPKRIWSESAFFFHSTTRMAVYVALSTPNWLLLAHDLLACFRKPSREAGFENYRRPTWQKTAMNANYNLCSRLDDGLVGYVVKWVILTDLLGIIITQNRNMY
jgi:hypothetical protein